MATATKISAAEKAREIKELLTRHIIETLKIKESIGELKKQIKELPEARQSVCVDDLEDYFAFLEENDLIHSKIWKLNTEENELIGFTLETFRTHYREIVGKTISLEIEGKAYEITVSDRSIQIIE